MKIWFGKMTASPSATFIAAVGAFVAGVCCSAIFFSGKTFYDFAPYWISAFACGIIVFVLPINKAPRFILGVTLFFTCGFFRYLTAGAPTSFVFFPQIKQAFMNATAAALPEPHASFVNGLLVGEGKLPAGLKAAFVATGTVHVMALSGWNLTVISKFLNNVFLFLPIGKRGRTATVALTLLLFIFLTGAPSSLVRAGVMTFVMIIAVAAGRESQAGRAVFIAAAIMLAISPRLVSADVGFLLSFAATFGLIYFGPALEPLFSFVPKRWNLRETAAATAAATFATLPIMLYSFGRMSFVSLPTNILLLPFVPATMLLGFLTTVASLVFLPLGRFVGLVAQIFTTYDLSLVKLFARVPQGSVNDLHAGFAVSLVMSLGFIAVAVYLKIKENDAAIS
jgi:competence protein ComEC